MFHSNYFSIRNSDSKSHIQRKLIYVCAILLFFAWVNHAHSASIWLEPSSDTVQIGETVNITIFIDFTNEPFLQGTFDVFYDSDNLSYDPDSFAYINPPPGPPLVVPYDCSAVLPPPSCSQPGELDGIHLSNWDVSWYSSGAVAEFSVIATSVGVAALWMNDHDLPSAGFIGIDGQPIMVDYLGATITVVPLPAAVWQFIGGLALMLRAGRFRKNSTI